GIIPWACSSGSRTSISAGLRALRSAASSTAGSISDVLPRISRSSVSKVTTAVDCHDPHVRVRCLVPGDSKMSELTATTTPSASDAPLDFATDAPGPESMVKITPVAAAKVNEIRDAEGIETAMALRLRVVGGGCAGFSY